MSNNVDKRIVEMQFDNAKFESGVQTTTKSLENLKKGLDLDASAQSLTRLENSGKSFSLDGIAAGVEKISSKFSALGIMGVTTLANITNSAINAGRQIANSLTIEPIHEGFAEYESGLNAFQTIMANTKSSGATIKDVNGTLAQLNDYANKTIYSFGDMTSAIGLFTAQGVKLKDSVTGIKGIYNIVSLTGGDANKANSAIYQLSQAIASGTVKAQDWISVVNAGIGGTDFQNQLKQTARTHGVAVDAMIKKEGSFKDSLQDGWLTSKILLETLSQYTGDLSAKQLQSMGYSAKQIKQIQDLGKTANDSATKLKTWTQLMDTLKSNVVTGWATTFKTIIGDFDQASLLWTSVNNTIGNSLQASSDARNKIMTEWAKDGGRNALLKALSNGFADLNSVIKPVKDAFKEIFPPMTGAKLAEITKGLEKLTEHLKLGSVDSQNLKDTFKGLFAILDLGKQAVSAIVKEFHSLTGGVFSSASSGILSFTGSIGRWITALDQSAKKADVFNAAFKKINDTVKPIVDSIKRGLNNIVESFNSLGSVDLKGLDNFAERVKVRFEPLTAIGDFMSKVIDKIVQIAEKIAPVLFKMGQAIGNAVGQIGHNISTALGQTDFNTVLDATNGVLAGGLLIGLKKLVDSLSGLAKNSKGIVGGLKSILDGVRGCLESYQKKIKADAIFKIATALGILTASVIALSLIDSSKLTSALTALSVMMIELFGSMAVFEKIMDGSKFKGINKVTLAMAEMGTAVLILSFAMQNLAKLDWGGIAKGLTAITVLTAELVASAKLMSNNSKALMKGSVGFIAFATAIVILTDAVKKLGALDTGSLIKGLVGVGVLAAELALFLKTADLDGMGVLKGTGLVLLAASINILAEAVKKFALLDNQSLVRGLLGVAGVLAELEIFVNTTGSATKVAATATGLVILGTAMLIFAKAIGNMGQLSWEQIGKGLTTMAASLTMVTIAVNLLPKASLVLTGVGLIAVSTALVILSGALVKMGGMSWEGIAKGLVTLAGSLAIIAVAMKFMTTALPGAAALLVISAALAILTPVLKALGDMSWEEIGKGLLTLVGVFAVLGVSGLVLGPVVPVILGLAGAIALLGVGCVAIGGGLLLFSAGLSALAVAGTAGTAALVATISAILGLIPMALTQIGLGIIAFANVIAQGGPALLNAITVILQSALGAIANTAPQFIDTVGLIVEKILGKIVELLPKVVDAGFSLLESLLQGISDHIEKVTNQAIDIVTKFVDTVASRLDDVIQSGVNFLLSFIEGITKAIRNNHQRLIDDMWDLGLAILQAVLDGVMSGPKKLFDAGADVVGHLIDGIKKPAEDIWNAGKNVVNGFINGIKDGFNDIIDAGKNLGNNLVNSVKKILGIFSPSRVFKQLGVYVGQGFIIGIASMSNGIQNASFGIANSAIKPMQKAIESLGITIISQKDAMNNYKKQLYEESDQYKQDTKAANEHKKALSDLQTTRNNIQKELDKQNRINTKAAKDKVAELKNQLNQTKTAIDSATKQIKQDQDDVATHTQETFDKLKQSISDSVKTTIDPLKASIDPQIDLFNKFGSDTQIVVSDLLANMQSQVTGVQQWNNDLNELGRRGFATGLLDKLRAMGPSGANYVKAFMDMTTDEMNLANESFQKSSELTAQTLLDNFSKSLTSAQEWSDDIAKLATTGLNQDMIEQLGKQGVGSEQYVKAFLTMTPDQIEQFNQQYVQYLKLPDSVSDEVMNSFALAGTNAVTKLIASIGTGQKDLTTAATKLGQTVYASLKEPMSLANCAFIGTNVCNGIIQGINAGRSGVISAAVGVAVAAYEAAKSALDINSPSKKFAELGMYSAKGFANGLKNFAGVASNEAAMMGTNAITSLKNTIKGIANAVNGDLNLSPTIRPVIDLSNVKMAAKDITSTLNKTGILDVSSIANKVSAISTGMSKSNSTVDISGSAPVVSKSYSFTQNNYSPKPLSRIEIYRQTNNQFSAMREAVKTK